MAVSGRLLAIFGICGVLCMPAYAQESATPAEDTQLQQQQAYNESYQAYQKAMIECYKAVVPQRDAKSSEPVDPAAYRVDTQKMQVLTKCMDEKGVSMPLNPYIQQGEKKYLKRLGDKNIGAQSAAAQAQTLAIQGKIMERMQQYQDEAFKQNGYNPAEDGSGQAALPVSEPAAAAPQPSLYNAAPGGSGNNDNGAKPLWVPQSQ